MVNRACVCKTGSNYDNDDDDDDDDEDDDDDVGGVSGGQPRKTGSNLFCFNSQENILPLAKQPFCEENFMDFSELGRKTYLAKNFRVTREQVQDGGPVNGRR